MRFGFKNLCRISQHNHCNFKTKQSSKFSLFLNLFSLSSPYFWDFIIHQFWILESDSQIDDSTLRSKQISQLSYCLLFHLFVILLCSVWTKNMLHAAGSYHHQTSYNPISLFSIFFFYDFSLFSYLQAVCVFLVCVYSRSI